MFADPTLFTEGENTQDSEASTDKAMFGPKGVVNIVEPSSRAARIKLTHKE